MAATLAVAVAYVIFVLHFAVNIPQGDEWGSELPIVDAALHGTLTFPLLWTQHANESHLLLTNAVFAFDGAYLRMDIRSIIAGSLALALGANLIALRLYSRYTGRAVGPVAVLCISAAWLSIGPIDNLLWAFQIQLYLTLFFLMAVLLMVAAFRSTTADGRTSASRWALVGALVAAVGATCSSVQGLLAWPIGLVVIAWIPPPATPRIRSAVVWCVSAVAMIGVYLIGYARGLANTACAGIAQHCSVGYGIDHPWQLARYFVTLVGNVVPARDVQLLKGAVDPHGDQVLGVLLLVACACVCVQSVRHRHAVPLAWLPVSMVLVGLTWDASIAIGRSGETLTTATSSHYASPQPFLLVAIVIFAGGSVLRHRSGPADGRAPAGGSRWWWTGDALIALLTVVIIGASTAVGGSNASFDRSNAEVIARTVVNLDRIPPGHRPCYLDAAISFGGVPSRYVLALIMPPIDELRSNRLSAFAEPFYRSLRAEGPADIPACDR